MVYEEQSKLPSLSKQCEHISQHASPEAAARLNSNLSALKASYTKLADSIRAKMNAISEAKITRSVHRRQSYIFGI